MDVVDLSRLQFALTALYHFLFCSLNDWYVCDAWHHGNSLRHDRP